MEENRQPFLIPELKDLYVSQAVERVKEAYAFSQHLGMGKLYVAFSGGKDSVCVYGVCKLASDEMGMNLLDMCEFHYHLTTVDPPELVWFIREKFPFVSIDRPKKTMWKLIATRCTMPPTRLVRYCCAELKERGGEGRFCLTGVRRAESSKRANRAVYETQDKDKTKRIQLNDNEEFRQEIEHCIPKQNYVVNPIIDWKDDEVWEFIHSQNLPYCKLYDEGWERVGCIGCPMATTKVREEEFARYPKYRDAYVRAFQKMLDNHKGKGYCKNWKDGEEVYQWWMYGDISSFKDDANTLFDEENEVNHELDNQ